MIETIRQEKNIKRLTLIYLAALGLIGAILIGGEFWIQAEQSRQSIFDQLLEASERYRRSGIQIVRKARELSIAQGGEERSNLLSELPQLKVAFVAARQNLQSDNLYSSLPIRDADNLTIQMKSVDPHYTAILAAIDKIEKIASEQTTVEPSLLSATVRLQLTDAYIDFASTLSILISDFLVSNTIQIQSIRTIQLWRLASTLGLLVLVGIIVFRPALQRTREAFVNLERTGWELAEARDEALESTRLKSAFLANMSHEIRTPLNGVVGMTEILLKTGLTAQQREFVRTIEASANSLLHVVDGLLDLAKIEAGKLILENQEFDLKKVIEEVVQILTPKAQAKGLEFIVHRDRDVPTRLIGDEARFSQVIVNLVDNAIKYTEKGEVFLRISALSKTETDTELLASVCDSGIGLSRRDQHKLFQPFNQADPSSTRRFGGAGLGLAISRQLASRMHGSIDVQSAPGSGATFHFRVRLRRQNTAARRVEAPSRDFADPRVLVVDDNKSNHGVIHIQLATAGIQSECVSNAAEALERIQDRSPQYDRFTLVILDMQKPDVDGVALARRIRSEPSLRDVRIFLMTSAESKSDRTASEPSIDARIMKPVNQHQLLSLIRSLNTDKQKVAEESPVAPEDGEPSTSSSAAGAHILLVEDNPTNQRILDLQLKDFGFRVDIAANGEEALERLRQKHYDLILMDCQMPVMDGYQTARFIRLTEGQTSTPIIALTAHAMNGDRQKCIDSGMDDYIAKPVKAEALKAAIERWLQPDGHPAAPPMAVNGTASELPTVDWNAFHKICGLANKQGDSDKLSQLIDSFLRHTEGEIEAIGQSLDEQDETRVAELAHSVRGSAGFYGAPCLAALCGKLEKASTEGDSESLKGLFKLIQEELARVREALEHEVATRSA